MDGISTPALPSALDARRSGVDIPHPLAGPSYEIIEGIFTKLLFFNALAP